MIALYSFNDFVSNDIYKIDEYALKYFKTFWHVCKNMLADRIHTYIMFQGRSWLAKN